MSESLSLYEVKFYLNTALCQSPPDISKTMKAMEYIRHFSIASRFNNGVAEAGVHHITLVLTNNNLSETKQWKIRLEKKLSELNVLILSSNKDSDISNMDQLWGLLMRSKNASCLPDLIVMCTHEKRTSDLVDLLSTLKNKRYNFADIGVHRISLTMMFDEADKNIKLISQCLKDIDPLLSDIGGVKKDNVIRDIHFVTATPFKDFWRLLSKANGIKKLTNINGALRSMDEGSALHTDYKVLMEDYRWLKEHRLNTAVADMTENTEEYVSKVLPLATAVAAPVPTVFAPSDMYIASHISMKNMLISRGYAVFMDNSKHKGFYDCHGGFQSLDDFNKKNNITGELYNTLVTWRRLNPLMPLAITGYLNVVRGITFNTIGFNFTDIIVSAYHMKDLASLIQLLGRANGGKKYVQAMNVICPQAVWTAADEYISLMSELHNANPDTFEESNFRPRKARDLQEPAWTIPVVIDVGETTYRDNIKHKKNKEGGDGKHWDKDAIIALIESTDSGLAALLKDRKCFQCTEPDAPDTYKKYVTDFAAKATQGLKFNMGIHKKDKERDGYQMFLDKKGWRIIISVYNGSLTVAPKNTIVESL